MKRGLALCGGGSKGSYQMGVWRALNELGIGFDIVCGTSIGSLNATMYVQQEYDRCLKLWKKTRNDTILGTSIKLNDKDLINSFKNMEDLLPFVKTYIKGKGADIEPFKKMLDEYVNPDKILTSPYEFGVVCVTFPSFKPVLVKVKDMPKEDIRKYILASCSCFPLFPICKIGKLSLIDGGYYDNLPIDFCLELGANEIVAVDLNFNITHKEYLRKPFVKYIYPSWDLGSFFDFVEKQINDNMILGYNDAMKAYGQYLGFRYTFYKGEDLTFLSHKYMLLLATVIKDFKYNKIKMLTKTDVYQILENRTFRDLDYIDYYTRAIEVALEYLNLDHLKVYHYEEAKCFIINEVLAIKFVNKDWIAAYNKLKTGSKKREYLSRVKEKDILAYCFNEVHDGRFLPKELVLDILANYPNVVIILILMMIWSDFDEQEERDFGFNFEFES